MSGSLCSTLKRPTFPTGGRLGIGINRQSKDKRRAFSFFALDPDLAAVGFNDHLGDHQSKACSLVLGSLTAGGLLVFLKKVRDLVWGNTDAGVLHPNYDSVSLIMPCMKLNRAAFFGKFKGIAN